MHFRIPYARETVELDVLDRNLAFYVHRTMELWSNQLPNLNKQRSKVMLFISKPNLVG